jgi:transcriptional regulator with XRE-family HTH domain
MNRINKKEMGERLKKMRKDNSLTLAFVSNRIKCSRNTLSALERGETNISLDILTLEELAHLYKRTLLSVLYGDNVKLMGEEEVANHNLYHRIDKLNREQKKLISGTISQFIHVAPN